MFFTYLGVDNIIFAADKPISAFGRRINPALNLVLIAGHSLIR
jgi:hypothetical protein